jgi:hypothetical protein
MSFLRENPAADHQSQRVSHEPRRPSQAQDLSKLTTHNLSEMDKQSDENADLYESEKKSRALQLAGEQLGFKLKLECYSSATTNVEDWCKMQHTLFEERPIFKDPQDITIMNVIAKGFDVALPHASVESVNQRSL